MVGREEVDEPAKIQDRVPMDPDELDAWLLANSPALSSFPLNTHEGRVGFLRELFNRGYPCLFEGISHVWTALEEPKMARCFGIGLAAGTGGKGKKALVKFLSQMIDEGLATISLVPPPDDFSSLEAWHHFVCDSWVRDEEALSGIFEKYAHLLVAHPFASKPLKLPCEVIIGPWSDDRHVI